MGSRSMAPSKQADVSVVLLPRGYDELLAKLKVIEIAWCFLKANNVRRTLTNIQGLIRSLPGGNINGFAPRVMALNLFSSCLSRRIAE